MENSNDFTLTETMIINKLDEEYSICEWIKQKHPVQFRDYGFDEVDREEAFFAMGEKLFDILLER